MWANRLCVCPRPYCLDDIAVLCDVGGETGILTSIPDHDPDARHSSYTSIIRRTHSCQA